MTRRSFFGMFGALSATTAAGIILPEPVKRYLFLSDERRYVIRRVKMWDVVEAGYINRIEVADSQYFPLDVVEFAGVKACFRMEFTTPQNYKETLGKFRFSTRDLIGDTPQAIRLLLESGAPSPSEIRSISFL